MYDLLAAAAISADIELGTIIVTESYIPSGHYMMSQDESSKSASISLHDQLQKNVSINSTQREGALSFRGLDHKATTFVEDGIPVYNTVNGFTDTRFNLNDGDIELNDGSGPGILGVSSMGGEVLLQSSRPSKTSQAKLKTTLTSNNKYLNAKVSSKMPGSKIDSAYIEANVTYFNRSDYKLSSHYDSTPLQGKGDRINSDKQQHGVSLKTGMVLKDGTHLAAKISAKRSKYGRPPNIYTDQIQPVWDAYTRMEAKDLNSYYLYADKDVNDISLSFRGYYDDYKDIWKIFNESTYQTNWPEMTYDDKRLGTIIKGSLNSDSHKSTLVFQFERNEHNAREEGALTDPKFVLDTYKGSYLHQYKANQNVLIDGAVSYSLLQETQRKNTALLQSPKDSSPKDKDVWDALLKLSYSDEANTYHAGIASKSRMPTMEQMFTFFPWEVANPGLKPERSIQYSAGYQNMLNDETMIDMSMYYYDIKDLIIYRNNGSINHDEAINTGLEIRLESDSYQNHSLQFSYAYIHARDGNNERLELIPEHRLKFEDTITISNNWEAYISYQYTSSRHSLNTATYTDELEKLSAYHLVDVQISYDAIKQTTFRAGIKNVFDEAYEWQYGYPTEGRSFFLSMELEM